MLKPESLKAKPADNYEDLKRQFFALKRLCESKINQCDIYSRKLAEHDLESVIARNEAIESEREMNAQLTEELEKANERIEELESYNLGLANESHNKSVEIDFLNARAKDLKEKNVQLRNKVGISSADIQLEMNNKNHKNKILTQAKIEALESCIDDNAMDNDEIDALIIYVDDVKADIEQLRKEQASE